MNCPLRAREFTSNMSMQECQPDCAWLVIDYNMSVPYQTGHCALAVIARELMGDKPLATRFVPVYEEDTC